MHAIVLLPALALMGPACSEPAAVSPAVVSEPVARQMAEGALRVGDADFAVAVTGIAGPTGGPEEKPVGTVFLGLAVKGKDTLVVKQFHPLDRDAFKRQVSQAALNLVRRALVGA